VRGEAVARVDRVLGAHRIHLDGIRRDPERAAPLVLAVAAHLRRDRRPEGARVRGERELRVRIVHHDDVSHPRRRGPAADDVGLGEHDARAAPSQRIRARRADDAAAEDEDVGGH